MPPQVLRTTAEAELRSQLCEPKEVNRDIPGQWWLPPWGGPKFFLQWSKEDHQFVDEQHLRCLLEGLARYRPLNNAGH
jgi:hypothetical protein